MKILLFLSFLFCSLGLSAQNDLAVSNIPKELLEGANAVVRYDNYNFKIVSQSEVQTIRTWAITILNEKGESEHATFRTYYDKLSKIKDIECSLYDMYGEEVKKLRRGDIEDIGLGYASSEVVDNRIKIAHFDDKKYEYPYTVEFHYIQESKNPMFFPTWYPSRGEYTSVESAVLNVVNNTGVPFRFKEINYNSQEEGKVQVANSNKVWMVENVPAVEHESMIYSPPQTIVYLAPSEFILDGVKGNLNSWRSASQFYYQLNEGRQQLPDATKSKIKSLTAGISDPHEKVKIVYEYMQSHTRYMSIQLGVGGWQTIAAEKVASDGYGDCKALTNYTVAMLKEVGVDQACAALIRAGKSSAMPYPDFSRMSFNHVIACVPFPKDTLWLECTSQTNPFGYLGSFTGNRKALLINANGGELVNTKSYTPEDNIQKRTTEIQLHNDGSAELVVNGTYKGIQQERRTSVFERLSAEEQKQWILKTINLPNFELKSFEFESYKESLPVLNEKIVLTSRKLASKSGKRMFLKLNPLSTFFGTPDKVEEREQAIYLNENVYNVIDEDELTYHLPEGIEIEYLPKETHIKSNFGSYDSTYEREGDVLTVTRKVKMQGGTYPASQYQEYYDFLKKVNKADKAKAVMVVGET